MSADDEERRVSPDEDLDPLDERTQPMNVPPMDPPTGNVEGDPSSADTTTLGASIPPPIILDDEPSEAGLAAVPSSTTSLAPSSSLRPMLLERVEPSLGRGERLRLDAAHWKVSLGRAEESDVRLYTASASRQHATIAGTENGEWLLTPSAGKSVLIDGENVSEPLVLEVGMNIVLGQDHLRCVTEGLGPGEMAARTASDAFDADARRVGQRLRRAIAEIPAAGWRVLLLGLALGVLAWLILGSGG